MIECNTKDGSECQSKNEILVDFEKYKIITGMGLVVPEKVIQSEIITTDNRVLHVLTSHYEKVSNNKGEVFRFAVKTFDKNVYSGTEWDKFEGKMDDVLVNAIIKDSDGQIKKEFSGLTKYGIFEDEIKIDGELIYPQGNYILELDVDFNGQKFNDILYFVIYEDGGQSFNNRPITNAGADGHHFSGDVVTLDGSNSSDQDDSSIFYTWIQTNGTDVILSDYTIVNPTFTIPDIFDTFIFNLLVDDGRKDANESDTITITSLHSDAGADRTLVNGIHVTINSTNIILDGSLSGDALSHSFTFDWSVLNQPTDSTITTSNLTSTTAEHPKFMPAQLGNYELKLIISDDEDALTDTDTVIITVSET